MLIIPTQVSASGINGNGVFTRRALQPGELVWDGSVALSEIKLETITDLPPETQRLWQHYGYWDLKEKVWKLPLDDSRFMNHSDRPTLRMLPDGNYVAALDLPIGTELTCNYREFTTWP